MITPQFAVTIKAISKDPATALNVAAVQVGLVQLMATLAVGLSAILKGLSTPASRPFICSATKHPDGCTKVSKIVVIATPLKTVISRLAAASV